MNEHQINRMETSLGQFTAETLVRVNQISRNNNLPPAIDIIFQTLNDIIKRNVLFSRN
uniref:Uncharacterized protein n=1 Tax=Octopus bimaculoides TaxID=37653 RepID=A0A0L8FKW1_OCTBM